ncbi:hypothetical protein DFH09DRAFT_1110791 [Mycena vulgaris]|nr:hypothetical protein DFH09DRAFT_1110791 [Mycena vulgaris]
MYCQAMFEFRSGPAWAGPTLRTPRTLDQCTSIPCLQSFTTDTTEIVNYHHYHKEWEDAAFLVRRRQYRLSIDQLEALVLKYRIQNEDSYCKRSSASMTGNNVLGPWPLGAMNEELLKMLETLFCMTSDSNEVEEWFCLCIIAGNVDIVSMVIMETELCRGNVARPLLLPDSSGNGGNPPMLNLLSRTVQAIGGKRGSLNIWWYWWYIKRVTKLY